MTEKRSSRRSSVCIHCAIFSLFYHSVIQVLFIPMFFSLQMIQEKIVSAGNASKQNQNYIATNVPVRSTVSVVTTQKKQSFAIFAR